MKKQNNVKGVYVNFGAGNSAPGWLNLDSSPFFLIPKFLHLLIYHLRISQRSWHFLNTHYQYYKFTRDKKLPFKDNSINVFYMSHFLEHITAREAKALFEEIYRTISKKGVVRIIVPDLERTYKNKREKSKDCWFPLNDHLDTLPKELIENKIVAVLEALHGFPSFHKTIILKSKINQTFGKKWLVKQNLKFLESRVDREKLCLIEKRERLKNSIVIEFYPKK